MNRASAMLMLEMFELMYKHLPGKHDQKSHTPKRYGRAATTASPGATARAWRDDPWAPYTEEVPTSFVSQFAEFRWSRSRSKLLPGQWDEMKWDIAENGIREPLLIEVNPKEGYALLTEGNHRLAMAQELGFPTVPVRVMRSQYLSPETHLRAKPVDVVVKPDEYGYVPGHMKPSEALGEDILDG